MVKNNIVETYEGNTSVTRTIQIYWHTQEGIFRYYPTDSEVVNLRLFDKRGKTIFEDAALIEGDDIIVTFPDNMLPGDYDYEVTITLENKDKPITVLSSKYHVERR